MGSRKYPTFPPLGIEKPNPPPNPPLKKNWLNKFVGWIGWIDESDKPQSAIPVTIEDPPKYQSVDYCCKCQTYNINRSFKTEFHKVVIPRSKMSSMSYYSMVLHPHCGCVWSERSHFKRTCTICGYSWVELTLDDPGNKEGR